MARIVIAVLALAALAIAGPVRINSGGPYIANIGWRKDTGLYASPGSLEYTGGGPVIATGSWAPIYNSHRWASSGNLEYKIPVPAGSFGVALLFAETWSGSALGVRQMVVKVNGANVNANGLSNGLLDVFQKAGGLNKPFYLNAGTFASQAGFITVTLERVAGKNNPMISGIVIDGATADSLLGNEGIGGAAASVAPPASAAPSAAPSGGVPSAAPSAAASAAASIAASIAASAAPSAATSVVPVPSTVPAGTCPVATSITGKLGTAGFVMNMGGPAVAQIGWGADNTNYIVEADKGLTAGAPVPVVVTGSSWVAPYQTHRYTTGASLTYKIPMPAGTYTVALLHAESYMTAAGQRVFNILINGVVKQAGFDVFAQVGKDKPLYKAYGGIQSVGGFIEIAFTKVTENPFVNGIFIQGPGAATLAIGGPENGECVSIGVSPLPTSVGVPSGKPVETDFSAAHFAHSVAGGPYVETDFDKDGKAAVNLDGSNSHSHKQVGTEVGKIVTYKWTWKDSTNPLAAADGTVTVTTAKATVNFPLGETTIALMVIDQFDNTASETTTVTVNSATVPGAYCYYYDLAKTTPTTVTLPLDVKQNPKPKKGATVGDINFASTASFDVPFADNTFSVRCVYFVDVATAGSISYKVVHSGPMKIYHNGVLQASSDSMTANTVTNTPGKAFAVGLQSWQIHYLRPLSMQGKLALQSSTGAVIPADIVRHDAGTTLPVITGLGKGTTAPEGGEIIGVFGTAFVNGVSIFFGTVEATTTEVTAGVIQAIAPPGTGTVQITVTTEAGTSNPFPFTYSATDVPVKFFEDTVKTTAGVTYSIPQIAVAAYGPDFRLYLGAVNSKVYALTLNKEMQVTKTCEQSVFQTYPRTVLGLAFNPKSNALKMFIGTSTIFWKDRNQFANFGSGWTNGKIQSLTIKPNNGCFNNDLTDVVTGLPVSNHDHAINAITFLPSGDMLIAVGGFTNGGISVPGDNLGGVHSNPLAGAIVKCPASGTAMTYSNLNDPVKSQITGGTCTTYATGLRNSYSMEYHTNKNLYATDNGPNQNFGLFSTDCVGGSKSSKNIPDKLLLIQPGKCHGHPSINRGECVFEDPKCVQPLIGNLQSSTNGILEYRSNTFGGKIKGDLFIAKFAVNGDGKLSRAQLNPSGTIQTNGFTNVFFSKSGLAIVEGPRGEMVMPRVYQSSILVAKPQYPVPATTTLISVMPRRGPAGGGATVLLTGHNFGASPTATFDGKACTNVQVIDADTFTCVTPAGTANTQVSVAVTGSAGVSISPGTDYWYF